MASESTPSGKGGEAAVGVAGSSTAERPQRSASRVARTRLLEVNEDPDSDGAATSPTGSPASGHRAVSASGKGGKSNGSRRASRDRAREADEYVTGSDLDMSGSSDGEESSDDSRSGARSARKGNQSHGNSEHKGSNAQDDSSGDGNGAAQPAAQPPPLPPSLAFLHHLADAIERMYTEGIAATSEELQTAVAAFRAVLEAFGALDQDAIDKNIQSRYHEQDALLLRLRAQLLAMRMISRGLAPSEQLWSLCAERTEAPRAAEGDSASDQPAVRPLAPATERSDVPMASAPPVSDLNEVPDAKGALATGDMELGPPGETATLPPRAAAAEASSAPVADETLSTARAVPGERQISRAHAKEKAGAVDPHSALPARNLGLPQGKGKMLPPLEEDPALLVVQGREKRAERIAVAPPTWAGATAPEMRDVARIMLAAETRLLDDMTTLADWRREELEILHQMTEEHGTGVMVQNEARAMSLLREVEYVRRRLRSQAGIEATAPSSPYSVLSAQYGAAAALQSEIGVASTLGMTEVPPGMLPLRVRMRPLLPDGDVELERVKDHGDGDDGDAGSHRGDLPRVMSTTDALAQEMRARDNVRRSFVRHVLHHARGFRDFHSNLRRARGTLVSSVGAIYSARRREEERREKERLRALRENDEEAYRRLLKDAKNERLNMLVKQTDDFLRQLGVRVAQERSSGSAAAADAEMATAADSGDEADDRSFAKDSYYAAVHAVREKISGTPECLRASGSLHSYQTEGLEWLVSLYNNGFSGILADEMGLGKTVQTISLLVYLAEVKNVRGPHLIVVPKSTMYNWMSELARWAPSFRVVMYDGDRDARREIQATELAAGTFNVMVTQYDLALRDVSVLRHVPWRFIVVDEGHRLKNSASKLATVLGHEYRSSNRLLLTGTPFQTKLREVWALLNFVLPKVFNSAADFENWFNAPFAMEKMSESLKEEEEYLIINRLHQVLRPFILRRTKQEIEMDLPPKRELVVKCGLSAWQQVMYSSLVTHGTLSLNPEHHPDRQFRVMANVPMQLRKVCNHPFLFHHPNRYSFADLVRASGKLFVLHNMLTKLRRTGHKVLIFSQMTAVLDIIEDYFHLAGYDGLYLRLDGTTGAEERRDGMLKFNRSDSPYFVYLLSTRAGGLGINLQSADTVIIFDQDWNPKMDKQAEARAHRIGQQREVRIFYFVSVGSVEETMLERARKRLDDDAKVIEAGCFNNMFSAEERKEMLYSLIRKGAEGLNTQAVATLADVNQMLARSDDELSVFASMDESGMGLPVQMQTLMSDEDVPEYSRHIYPRPQEETVLSEGAVRSARKREVFYDDGLSEGAFLRAVEGGEDLADVSARAWAKRRRTDGSHGTPRASGRALGATVTASVAGAEQMQLSDDDTGELPDTEVCTRLLRVYRKIRYAKERRTGRLHALRFLELPDRTEHPEFYQLVDQPITLRDIKEKVLKDQYRTPSQMTEDLDLLFSNFELFYDEEDKGFRDCTRLRERLASVMEREFSEEDIKAYEQAANEASNPASRANSSFAGDDDDGDDAEMDLGGGGDETAAGDAQKNAAASAPASVAGAESDGKPAVSGSGIAGVTGQTSSDTATNTNISAAVSGAPGIPPPAAPGAPSPPAAPAAVAPPVAASVHSPLQAASVVPATQPSLRNPAVVSSAPPSSAAGQGVAPAGRGIGEALAQASGAPSTATTLGSGDQVAAEHATAPVHPVAPDTSAPSLVPIQVPVHPPNTTSGALSSSVRGGPQPAGAPLVSSKPPEAAGAVPPEQHSTPKSGGQA